MKTVKCSDKAGQAMTIADTKANRALAAAAGFTVKRKKKTKP